LSIYLFISSGARVNERSMEVVRWLIRGYAFVCMDGGMQQ